MCQTLSTLHVLTHLLLKMTPGGTTRKLHRERLSELLKVAQLVSEIRHSALELNHNCTAIVESARIHFTNSYYGTADIVQIKSLMVSFAFFR